MNIINFFKKKYKKWSWIILIVLSIIVSAALFYKDNFGNDYHLKISAGSFHGRRHEIAKVLEFQCSKKKIYFEFVESKGSVEALEMVSKGEIDLAFIQGGLPPAENVTQIAVIHHEPLHLIVKKQFATTGIQSLKGRSINLSSKGSGTHMLANNVLDFIGLNNHDYTETNLSYGQIDKIPDNTPLDSLPDAFFMVSSLPSKQVYNLTNKMGYELIEIPFGHAYSMQFLGVQDLNIPEYTYGVVPPNPARAIKTIGSQLLLIAHTNVPKEAVKAILEAIYEGEFFRQTNIKYSELKQYAEIEEFELHPGVVEYKNRLNPAITSETMESLENFRSFVFSLVVALFFLWRWYDSRKGIGLNNYLLRVNIIQKKLVQYQTSDTQVSIPDLELLNKELNVVKSDAIDHIADGKIKNTELLNSLLTDVNNIKSDIFALIEKRQKSS
ncbi:MAG: TAXI family TRAP transporter solute-binding subunit [Cytophagales bacterium]|nr:TAXI family TRAP transporter solute-binding subunit [Cytophagales bacterium]